MLNLIRKDFLLVFFSSKVNLLAMILLTPLMNLIIATSDYRVIIGGMIISLGYLLTSISFAYDMTGKSHLLIQSLPIKKRELVISKYISVFINCIVVILYIGGYLWITSLFGLRTVDSFKFSLIKEILSILILGLSISLPLQFSLPAKLANFIHGFIMIILINMIVIDFNSIIGVLNANYFANFKLLAIATVTYLISMLISIWIYERKDLI